MTAAAGAAGPGMRIEPMAVGGKAAGLYRLAALGLRVPPFRVLPADMYRAACPGGVAPERLPAEVEALLDRAWIELEGERVPLAVRSSAVEEDGAERSYAGQMETFLDVRTREALADAVRGCWRSLRGARAAAYRAARGGAAGAEPAMAVVIQQMVRPDASGVLFTVNPVARRADQLMVSAVWGLGEGLVSGALDADTFVLDRAGRVLSRQLAHKTEQVVPADGGGTRRAAVLSSRSDEACLAPGVLGELVRLAMRAESAAGHPLDIEFAVRDGGIYFLQARPVTAFTPAAPAPDPPSGPRKVWDNSNIVESYPGITLPLTFSFILRAYRAVYWQFCQVLGLSEKDIRAREDMLSSMLGHIRGRVYYDLMNWYRLVALLPGFEFNKEFMEGMMGLRNPEPVQAPAVSGWRKCFCELPRLIRSGLRAVWLQATLERRIRRFHAGFEADHARFSKIGYERLSPSDVMRHYFEMEQAILWRWKAPIINDFSAMVFYGVLRKLTVAWNVDPDGSIQNALISRQGSMESIEVAARLWRIAEELARDGDARARVLAETPEKAAAALEACPKAARAFRAYLERYGDRCIAELKLESRTMRDDPAFAMAMVQNYLRQSAVMAAMDPEQEQRVRREAESRLAGRMRERRTRCGLSRAAVYRWVLVRARRAIRNRENQRLARTRAFGIVRGMFRSIGRSLEAAGLLAGADDVFYLTLEEIAAMAEGRRDGRDFAGFVAARRKEYEEYRRTPPPPDHFVTVGGVIAEEAPPAALDSKGVMHGLGACPGIVERPAVLLFEPDTSVRLDGEILVTRQTDPGWVLLFPAISGLVVERGSMLSHSAIVAREMGIPAVVGVKDACRRIRTGDRLRLDGARGTVEILGDEE